MIIDIRHKGLRLFWETDNCSKLPQDQVKKIRDILTMLDTINNINELRSSGFGLHTLKGDLAGYWSVVVNANWRIIFKFENGNTYLVDYLDYH